MKAKVLVKFKDKNTKIIHKPGETLDMTPERMEEINKSTKNGRKFVQYVEEEKESEA